MGLVTRYLIEEVLTRKVRKYGVVVWYDPSAAFSAFAAGLAIERVRVLQFHGSYYRLRRDAEEVFSRLDRNSVSVEEGLIVYVNAEALDKKTNVLLGLEKAGTRFDWSLSAVVREALKDRVPRTTLDAWLSNDGLTLADLDRLASGEIPGEAAAIGLIFGTTTPSEVALRCVAEPEVVSEVEKRGAFQELTRFLSAGLGLPSEDITSQEILRKRLGRHVLMTEFLSEVGQGNKVPELARVVVARKESQVETCRLIARGLRDRWRNRDEYISLARAVEAEFNLRSLKIDAGILGGVDTFPFVEEVLLRSLQELATSGEVDAAMHRIEERRASFWTIVDPIRAVQWRTAETALQLCVEAARVLDEVRSTKASPPLLAKSYAQGDEGRGRWYGMDTLDRRLEWLVTASEGEFELSGLLRLAREKYAETARVLADRFLQALRSEGFVFGAVSQQTDVFATFIRPAIERGKVAYVTVSGLRYEMAVEVLDALSVAEKSELRPVIAVPPTLPAIGLAALLAGAEGGITLREMSGDLAAEIDGNALVDAADRLRFIRRRLGEDAIVDLPLTDLLTKRVDAIRRKIEGKKLLLVRGPEIERVPLETRALHMRKLMGDLLSDLRRSVRRLRDLGVSQIVLASGHGCLLSWGLGHGRVEPPDGHAVTVTARAWVGRGGGSRPDFARFQPSELGIGGELDIAVPLGLDLFELNSEPMPYIYGGLSPQEVIAPLAIITTAGVAPAGAEDEYELIVRREQVTNRLFTVTIRYHRGSLLSGESRRVRIVARSGNEEIGRAATAVHGFDQTTGEVQLSAGQENHVTIMLSSDVRQGTLHVAIVDPDTEVALKRTADMAYDLAI